MSIKDLVLGALAPLADADSAEQVAELLRAEGVRGVPGCPHTCALANYAVHRVRAAGAVGPVSVDVFPQGRERRMLASVTLGDMFVTVPMGVAVDRFVWGFDRHRFPDLELGEE